jgi:hypothetical protein
LAVLSYRQQREIEVYAGIEPIGGMAGVSSPPAGDDPAERTQDEELQMFEQIKLRLGAAEEEG